VADPFDGWAAALDARDARDPEPADA
jgi:hypothetical protein